MATILVEFFVNVKDGIKEIIKYTWWNHVKYLHNFRQ